MALKPRKGRTAMKVRRILIAALATLLSAHSADKAAAQGHYPERAIRILVGFTPGVAPDVAARIIGDKLSEAWGKPIVVENISGAGGNIATDHGAKPVRQTLLRSGQGFRADLPNFRRQ